MEKQIYITNGNGAAGANRSGSDPRCRMVEHIVAQYDNSADYARDVHNETKVGAARQPAIYKMIKTVISEY